MRRAVALGLLSLVIAGYSVQARAFGIFGTSTLEGGFRWDAAPRLVVGPRTPEGKERSLQGGLTYSLQGGSYEAFRDSLRWGGGNVPNIAAFQAAVDGAFAQWMASDPATGLGTDLRFVADFATAAIEDPYDGAEIDLIINPRPSGYAAFASLGPTLQDDDITLTSGTTDYPGGAIGGADIYFNGDVIWDLLGFKLALAHEIGHALGLNDVDITSGPAGLFIDDNYDGTSGQTAYQTLTNSFASLVDPYDPASSPLGLYRVRDGSPGFDSPGAFILMESNTDGVLRFADPQLQNDDFAGRQFLYPWVPVPEPGAAPLIALGLAGLAAMRRRHSAGSGGLPDLRRRLPRLQVGTRRGERIGIRNGLRHDVRPVEIPS